MTSVELLKHPTDEDWMEVKRRALVTVGKTPLKLPDDRWKRKILEARHSPIRYLMFSYYLHDIPTWVSVHLVRHHEGFQPYVKSQRNDRQDEYDRNAARQDTPVDMIIDLNAEALMNLANKRLCRKAAFETRNVVATMTLLAEEACPEFEGLFGPMCEYHGGVCHEMNSCGRWSAADDN